MTMIHADDCPGRPGYRGICNCTPVDTDERIAALARELAACRLALLNERTDKEAAQQEAAHLRDARTASMADALTATHATRLSMFRGAGR